MATAQTNPEFPLISLPTNHQLLVLSLENKKTYAETIEFIVLSQKESVIIQLSGIKAIKTTFSAIDALAEFNRVFDQTTKNKHHDRSLRRRLIEALNYSLIHMEDKQEIMTHIYWLSKTYFINLLNVEAFKVQFKEIHISNTALQYMENEVSIKSLLEAARLLSNQISSTNKTINEFLDYVSRNNKEKLQWSINHLKMQFSLERVTRAHTMRILEATLEIPNKRIIIAKLTSQLLRVLESDTEKQKTTLTKRHHHFLKCGLLPEFDPLQEIINMELRSRIYNLDIYDSHITLLHDFYDTLNKKFGSQISCCSFDEKLLDNENIASK